MGSQRYECIACKKSYAWRNPHIKHLRQYAWFKLWITQGYTIKQLARQSGYSPRKLRGIINFWLAKSPRLTLSSHPHLIVDGSFLEGRKHCVFVVMNGNNQMVHGEYDLREQAIPLTEYFTKLRTEGLEPVSATVDGKPVITKALLKVWPEIIIQRCLVHLQRQGLMWCRRSPKRYDAKQLRKLLLTITDIHTKEQRDIFFNELAKWEQRYGAQLAALPPKGWVLTDLQRARSMVLHALPDMFHYLNHHDIPRTTNTAEGYFSRLKLRYRQHRGLSRKKLLNYFMWYFTLVRR